MNKQAGEIICCAKTEKVTEHHGLYQTNVLLTEAHIIILQTLLQDHNHTHIER